ncbi:ADP-dependent NAD(P)H-hydrate dehydratase [Methanobrevibacter arboriphilus]|uniref:ADP-dependent NAD(P)H-hydrate dehydratase n=1 Tax=Methanobrevibacter arboriphilus TaxID=39441 RepID=UPI000AFD47B8|nr:ADP/ATP-dependent (S)-NAD(P)H-hydrate dehydratase [Methanobrevibacter arboriphilus]
MKKLENYLIFWLKKIDIPIVLDADALKLVNPLLIKDKDNLIVTPHLNELKIFFNDSIDDLNNLSNVSNFDKDFDKFNEKISVLQGITRNINGTLVLKGKYDLIFNGISFRINRTGNSGMTVGGTGDSLAGIATSLLSQGLNSYDAGALATYLNGKAGDFAKEQYGNGFLASHLSEFLGILMENIY